MNRKIFDNKFYGVMALCMLIAMVFAVGCGSEVKNETLSWTITVQECQIKDKMEAVDDVRQYDGSIAKVPHSNVPSDGNVFVLLKLDLKKNAAGNHPLKWQEVTLEGKGGESCTRIQDVFLTDYGYDRLAGTDAKLDGQGWICFEVPKDMAKSEMKVVYVDGDRKNILPVKQ